MKHDTRRICDGVRIHPWLGEMLASVANAMRNSCELKFRNDQFNRVALPLLEAAELIVKIEPKQQIPTEIPQREQNLIKRQMNVPIWLFDMKFYQSRKDPNQIRKFLVRSAAHLETALLAEVNAVVH